MPSHCPGLVIAVCGACVLSPKGATCPPPTLAAAAPFAPRTVLRSKGFMWMSNSHSTAYYWSHAGQHFEIRDEGDWWVWVPGGGGRGGAAVARSATWVYGWGGATAAASPMQWRGEHSGWGLKCSQEWACRMRLRPVKGARVTPQLYP